jgi:hypothetical protein
MNGLRKCGIHSMEFYSAMKNNESMLFADKLMELENIMLSDVSQAQKNQRSHVFSYVS